jgi:parallel beta-helix repeat protein
MAAGNNMSLKGVTSPPSDPSNYGNMSKYVDANLYIGPSALSSGQQLSSDPHNWLFLNVSYTDADWINAGITNESDIKIAKKTSNWYTDPAAFADTYGIDTINNYVYANLTNFGSIFAPLGKISNISSCPIMDSSGSYRLINNITNSTAPACINITASNVILDCQGYSINGANNLNTQGIKIAPSSGSINNITIQNCIITGWDKGIGIFAGASGVVINNNTFRLNYGSEASAIHIENTTGINITNNNASGNGAVPGIYFYNVNSSLIQNNTANSNQHGIQLVSSNSNTITDNTANSNTNHGIYLSSSSNYNNITNNNANSNTQDGILLMSSSNYNTLTSNNANSNTQYGIHLFGSNNNSLTGNTVSSNSAYDIYLDTTLSTIFTNQQIASYPTTLSFTYLGDYALKGVTSPPSTPEPFRNIGKYVNVVAVSGVGFPSGQQLSGGGGGGWLFLNISYSSSDLTAASVMNESSMRLAKYNGSWYTGPAAFASTYNVNTGANYVYANITSFGSTFAPLGIPPQAFGQVNVSVEPMLSITLVDNLVDFGTGFVTAGNAYADIDSNSTDTGNWTNTSAGIHGWPGNRDFMTLDNNGNVKANVNISAGDSAATFIGGTGPDQWYAAEDNESVSCDGILQSTYTTLGISQTSLCTSLRNNDSTDTINILFKLRVPSDATPSAKTNTITFSAVEA